MLLTIYSNKIKKLQHATAVKVDGQEISLEEWEDQNLADQNEIVKNTSCYNIPKSWLLAIKNHKFTTSNYIKQALFEKLTRDGLI